MNLNVTDLVFEKDMLDYCLNNSKALNIPDMSFYIYAGSEKFPIASKELNILMLNLIHKTITHNQAGKRTTNKQFFPIMSNTNVKIAWLKGVNHLSNKVSSVVAKVNVTNDNITKAKAMMDYIVKAYANV